MEYTSRNSKKSHNMVKEKLGYLLSTKLSLTHENRDESIELTKLINTDKKSHSYPKPQEDQ